MVSMRLAVERGSSEGLIGPTRPLVGLRDVASRLQPMPRGSTRALAASLLRNALHRPFAVILCRFKGAPKHPDEQATEDFYRGIFTPGRNGLVEYWQDVSLGRVDIKGSQVFGWIEVDLSRDKADVNSGANRSTLVKAAMDACARDGIDVVTGFHKQISVYLENWSRSDVPPGLDWSDKIWGKYWIDGSADRDGRINLTPPHNGNVCAHEMGHALGLDHDHGPDLVSDYGDWCCIMSQSNSFLDPSWGRAFGPAVCLPHLTHHDWMYRGRVYDAGDGWLRDPNGISLPLAPIDRPGAAANLGLKLSLRPLKDWDYYVEFTPATGWNRGLAHPNLSPPYLFVRTIDGGRPTGLCYLPVPTTPGVPASIREPHGSTVFEVRLTQLPGPVIEVKATRV